jgi:hypothetical protein
VVLLADLTGHPNHQNQLVVVLDERLSLSSSIPLKQLLFALLGLHFLLLRQRQLFVLLCL